MGLAGTGRDGAESIEILVVKLREIVVKLRDLVGCSDLRVVRLGRSAFELSSSNQPGAKVRVKERNEKRGVRTERTICWLVC